MMRKALGRAFGLAIFFLPETITLIIWIAVSIDIKLAQAVINTETAESTSISIVILTIAITSIGQILRISLGLIESGPSQQFRKIDFGGWALIILIALGVYAEIPNIGSIFNSSKFSIFLCYITLIGLTFLIVDLTFATAKSLINKTRER